MANKVRLGFVGAGGMARQHTGALKNLPDVEIVGFTDVYKPAAEAMAEKFNAQVFDTPEELAAHAGVDALYILLPPFAHGDAERAALKHKLPFFVEKPVGLDMGLAREIAAEVNHLGLMTAAGYMNRYRSGVNFVREQLLAEPAILAHGGWWGGSPGPASTQGAGSWWTDKSKSGGQFHEQVTHIVDLVRYLFGEAQEVFAYAATGFNRGISGYTMDDAATVAIKFKNGGIANLMASVSSNAGGAIYLDVHSLDTNYRFNGWEHSVVIRKKGADPVEIQGEGDIFGIEDAAFVEAIRTGDGSGIRSTYPDAVQTLAISLAANQSIATGKPVAL